MFKLSVPGSAMLLGEHAVLYDYPAVVCAINKRINVGLTVRQDNKICLSNSRAEELVTRADCISEEFISQHPQFSFVLAAIDDRKHLLKSGFELHIDAEFSDKVGFGSSAAVTVATLAVLNKWLCGEIKLLDIYQLGVKVVRLVQGGLGSGADVAASVFGGTIAYRITPFKLEQLPIIPELILVYSGYKTPTPVVIKKIQFELEKHPKRTEKIFQDIGSLVEEGIGFIANKQWGDLGRVFNLHYVLQKQLGVSDSVIEALVDSLINVSTIHGAKISGAGLGDCVVALGRLEAEKFSNQFEVQVAKVGISELG